MVIPALRIQHIVDFPHLDSHMVTTRDYRNKIHLFFITQGQTYRRNGLNDTWEALSDQEGYLQACLAAGLNADDVCRYTTAGRANFALN